LRVSDGSKRPNSQRGQCGGNRTLRQEIVRRAGYAPDFCHNAGAQGVPKAALRAFDFSREVKQGESAQIVKVDAFRK